MYYIVQTYMDGQRSGRGGVHRPNVLQSLCALSIANSTLLNWPICLLIFLF